MRASSLELSWEQPDTGTPEVRIQGEDRVDVFLFDHETTDLVDEGGPAGQARPAAACEPAVPGLPAGRSPPRRTACLDSFEQGWRIGLLHEEERDDDLWFEGLTLQERGRRLHGTPPLTLGILEHGRGQLAVDDGLERLRDAIDADRLDRVQEALLSDGLEGSHDASSRSGPR